MTMLTTGQHKESDTARRCFPMDKPDYERIKALVRRYHRKDHVTTAWWEEEMWGSKHRGRVVLVTRPATAEDYAEARYRRRADIIKQLLRNALESAT
jgi:hypothetical protein